MNTLKYRGKRFEESLGSNVSRHTKIYLVDIIQKNSNGNVEAVCENMGL
jgi:hypothetical protein